MLQFFVTLLAAAAIFMGLVSESVVAVVMLGILWIVITQNLREVRWNFLSILKHLFWIFVFGVTIVATSEISYAIYFLIFFFINRFGMVQHTSKYWWLSIFVFMCLCCMMHELSVIVLSIYWYFFYRHHELSDYIQQKNAVKINFGVEIAYGFCMFASVISMMPSNYYRSYHVGSTLTMLLFFGILSFLAYRKRRSDGEHTVNVVSSKPINALETEDKDTPEPAKEKSEEAKSGEQREVQAVKPKPVPTKKPSEFWKNVAAFIKNNIGNLLLLFGVLFVLTALVTFLRSNWDQFKYIVFVCYCLLTISLFAGSYYIFFKKKSLVKLSLLLSLLATIFFPFVFYFAVKIGLLEDHGNKYTVFWMTTILSVIHMRMYHSTIFTFVSSVLTISSTFLTLQKFVSPYYETYAIAFAILALLQFATRLVVSENKRCEWILIGTANIVFVATCITSLLFWDAYVFAFVMMCGIGFALWQINTILHTWNAYFYGLLFAGSSLGLTISLCCIADLSTFWLGVPTASVALLLLHNKIGKKETTLALHHCGFVTPIVLFLIYIHYGAYSSYEGQLSVLLFSLLSTWGYTSCNARLQKTAISYCAIIFQLLAIAEILKILHLDVHIYSCVFLVWATIAAWLSVHEKWREYEWLTAPLQRCSLWTMPAVLFYLVIWGHDFYYNHFFTMCLILLMTSAFCIYTAILLRRNDLIAAGVAVFITLCTMIHNYYDYSFHYLAAAVVFFCIVALYLARMWAKVREIEISERILGFILIPIVTTFSTISTCMALGNEVWQVHIVLILAVLFFVMKYALHPQKTTVFWGLGYITLSYFMFTCNGESFFDWGMHFAILAIILALGTKFFAEEITETTLNYVRILFIVCSVQFIAFIRFYYHENAWFPALLVVLNAVLAIKDVRLWLVYGFFVHSYALYFFLLPQGLFTFQYALFFIPVAIGLFAVCKRLPQIWVSPTWMISHATVLFFLLLPIALPGMVPSAFISMWVIAMAFVFYFVCLYYEKKPLYSYISTALFSGCALVALFASKSLWGAEIALAMAVISALIATAGYFVLQKEQDIARPIFYVVMSNVLLISLSLVFIGKINYPTLLSLLLSSMIAAVTVYLKTTPAGYYNTCAFFSMALFALANYLIIEKMDLHPVPSGLLVIFLAAVHLFVARISSAVPSLQKAFFFAATVLPLLSLIHAHASLHITLFMALASVMYLVVGYKQRITLFAPLGLTTAAIACYSFVAFMYFSYENLMILSVMMGVLLLYAAHFIPEKFADYAMKPLTLVAYGNYAVFLLLFLVDANVSVYLVAVLTLANSVVLLYLYTRSKQHLTVAGVSFAFSYYVILFSWATSVWEFYTVPVGMAMIAYAYYLHRKHSFAYYKDLLFVGLLMIFVPTLVQSYHGWFDHLYALGVSPYYHLTHSFFLVVESLIILLVGAYRKELLFFFTGLTFLLADVTLVLFAYVNFGVIPQSIWWAGLGVLCIGSWVIIEYKKEWLNDIRKYLSDKKSKWREDLKTWS
ncbi:hypothetical protein [Candidatus Uabimicrobium amorphum]|uniref:Uncharacterized protein n=1 Tax=Uabimicrobium amorphum TaxID=2596890 RepID=A0A5S9F441_UABAM|nr:hypothetical protein [Candidatus Uabimicrobium amorphum]BBM85142.1 hypothetical protein UABAM_03505 [Candidatus Uabimicrobium amorphum]